MRSLSRRADDPGEINEAEIRAGCETARPEISRDFELFLSLRLSARRLGEELGRRSKVFQNLLGWPFFTGVRSYILIVRQDADAILYIPRDLSLSGCRRSA